MSSKSMLWLIAVGLVWGAAVRADEPESMPPVRPDVVTGVEQPLPPGATVTQTSANRVTIRLNKVPVPQVLDLFARLSGANIVAATQATDDVSANLQDVEWESALRAILDTVDLGLMERTPGIYTVVRKADLEAEGLVPNQIQLKFSTVPEMLPVVRNMLVSSNASAIGFASSNTIIIRETPSQVNAIREMIRQIDRERPQVYIEVKFVELNDTKASDIGIDWQVLQGYTVGIGGISNAYSRSRSRITNDSAATSVLDRRTEVDTRSRSQTNNVAATNARTEVDTRNLTMIDALVQGRNFTSFDPSDGSITTVPVSTTTDVLSAVLTAENFALTLSALEQKAGVEVVSDPKIVVASGQTATIHVGRNEPNVVALPQGDFGDRFAYTLDSERPFIEIGVKLNVTPTVNTDDNITVRITPELSRKLGDRTVGEAGTTFPITQTRRIVTEFNVPSGRTVAIGGLTTEEDRETVKRVPVLGSIPVIGKYLFTHRSTERIKDEVIIFVTVHKLDTAAMSNTAGIPSQAELIYPRLDAYTNPQGGAAYRAAKEKEQAAGAASPAPPTADPVPVNRVDPAVPVESGRILSPGVPAGEVPPAGWDGEFLIPSGPVPAPAVP